MFRVPLRCSAAVGAVAFLMIGGLCAGLQPAATEEQRLPQPPLPAATRGPLQIAFTPGGDRALVTEGDTGTLAVIRTASGEVLRRIPTGGEQPSGVAALSPRAALVTNALTGSLALLDLETGRATRRLDLRGEPTEVVLSLDRKQAFVSLPQLDQVAVIAVPELEVRKRIAVGRRPRALALTPDGGTLLAANFQGGDVSLIDTVSLTEQRRIGLTGINLRDVAVSLDGRRAYVTGQIPANTRLTVEPLDIWVNTVFVLDLRREAVAGSAEGWIDFPLGSSPDPDGVVALAPERVAVTLAGSDETLLLRTPGPYLRSYDPMIERRVPVGARPRAVALLPERGEVWVANQLDSSLSVLESATLRPLRRVALGVPPEPDPRLPGRYLFGNAGLTRGRQFTCNSCHPDGYSDGLDWEFAHVRDGVPRRNSRSLRGGLSRTAPFRWSGHNAELEEFVQEEITGLLGGEEQGPEVLQALLRMVEHFPLPANPHREPGGELSPAARRGEQLFHGRAGCSGCHQGELKGGTGLQRWVGTTREGLLLDVPHLHGVHDTAPYLHDGRARSLEEIFSRHNPAREHGQAHLLSSEELADLLRYVREL